MAAITPIFDGFEITISQHQWKHDTGQNGSKWQSHNAEGLKRYIQQEIIPQITTPLTTNTFYVTDLLKDFKKYGYKSSNSKDDIVTIAINIYTAESKLEVLHCFPESSSPKMQLGIGTKTGTNDIVKFTS